MYEVWFIHDVEEEDACLFVANVPSAELAHRIATNLVEEGFAFDAWFSAC
jgi:hypothetical protein